LKQVTGTISVPNELKKKNASARAAMEEAGEKGPIRTWHIREAYRRLKNAGKIHYEKERRLFKS
jgi:hypothetical protein